VGGPVDPRVSPMDGPIGRIMDGWMRGWLRVPKGRSAGGLLGQSGACGAMKASRIANASAKGVFLLL
jgi:hypothetical protein